ncbi:MAG: NADH-quinone oxidoreductase subunit B family protein, partial [Bacilli bacterium]
MNKPKVAIFDFAGCEGCQLQIVNMEEEILDLISVVDLVEWREGMSEQGDEYDVAIIEGSITRPQDEEKLRQIRERAKILVALGACATDGGVNKLKNYFDLQEVRQLVYGADSALPHLDSAPTKAVDEVVQVDYKIYGCPIDRREFAYVVRSLVMGKRPEIPNYPVCVECKRRENVCRYEFNEICLGPVTRAGCDARCPSFGVWCFGCRGSIDEPNVQAAREDMER